MSSTVSPQHPAVVLRSHYLHLRMLLVVTIAAVVGLTAAVVVLATSNQGSTTIINRAPSLTPAAVSADTGARLDHRGLLYRAPTSATADTGARLDHRGLHYRAPR